MALSFSFTMSYDITGCALNNFLRQEGWWSHHISGCTFALFPFDATAFECTLHF